MVSAWVPTPCVGKSSVSDILCGVNKQRLLKAAEKAAIALQRWFMSKVQPCSLITNQLLVCSTWAFWNTRACILVCLVPKELNLQLLLGSDAANADAPPGQGSQVRLALAEWEKPQGEWVSAVLQRRPCWGRQSSFITSFRKLSPKV